MSIEEKPKRKTTTSNEVKDRYKKKTYDRISLYVHKDKAQAYKTKCEEMGIAYSEPLHKAIEDFLNQN